MQTPDDLDLVFWTASVRAKPFADQLRAAAAGGFTSFAMPPSAYLALIERGLKPATIRRMAEDHGVPVRHIDVVSAWTSIRVPAGAPDGLKTILDVPMDRIREMLDAFDVATILAMGGYDAGTVPLDAAIAGFADLCDEVAPRGIAVNLEFLPFWGIPDLSAAWTIVKGAGRPNGGILLDTWHFMRGAPDLDLLRAIPGHVLIHVLLADAPAAMAGRDLTDDTLNHRRFPGEGDLPIADILAIVAAKGHLRHVGAEVFSLEADTMSWNEAGRRAGSTTRACIEAAFRTAREEPRP